MFITVTEMRSGNGSTSTPGIPRNVNVDNIMFIDDVANMDTKFTEYLSLTGQSVKPSVLTMVDGSLLMVEESVDTLSGMV